MRRKEGEKKGRKGREGKGERREGGRREGGRKGDSEGMPALELPVSS